jgi:hypothetical protein
LLIDSTHRRWALAALLLGLAGLGLYLVIIAFYPGQMKGGSTTGLWYGIVGSGLMVYAGLLSFLRRVPSWWWIGARKTWLRGHIWLGLLSGLFILCHSGFRWGGPLEVALWVVVIVILATGVYGLLLQQVLPRLLTTRIPAEAPYEQIPHLCSMMRRRADNLVDDLCGSFDPDAPDIENTRAAIRLQEDGRAQLRTFYEKDIRPFLVAQPPRASLLLDPLQTEARFAKLRRLAGLEEKQEDLQQLAKLCEERRQLADQERIHFWLHSWLLLHIPLSVALLVLGVVHAVTALSSGTIP